MKKYTKEKFFASRLEKLVFRGWTTRDWVEQRFYEVCAKVDNARRVLRRTNTQK